MKRILFTLAMGAALAAGPHAAQAASCGHGHHRHCAPHERHHYPAARVYDRNGYVLWPDMGYGPPPYASGLFDFPPDAPGGLLNDEPRPVSENPQQWIMRQTHDRPYSDDEPY